MAILFPQRTTPPPPDTRAITQQTREEDEVPSTMAATAFPQEQHESNQDRAAATALNAEIDHPNDYGIGTLEALTFSGDLTREEADAALQRIQDKAIDIACQHKALIAWEEEWETGNSLMGAEYAMGFVLLDEEAKQETKQSLCLIGSLEVNDSKTQVRHKILRLGEIRLDHQRAINEIEEDRSDAWLLWEMDKRIETLPHPPSFM